MASRWAHFVDAHAEVLNRALDVRHRREFTEGERAALALLGEELKRLSVAKGPLRRKHVEFLQSRAPSTSVSDRSSLGGAGEDD